MESIDEYANENYIRSVVFTALEQRQAHQYTKLLPISSELLIQRVRILAPSTKESWDKAIQWQQDNCPTMIESLWSSGGSVADEIYQKPVYYKRMDADTCHALIEFAELDTHHFVIILIMEQGSGDISDLKYYNTKELTEPEWLEVFESWSRSLDDAERVFLTKVTRNKRVFKAGTPGTPDSEKKEAPEDYWGDWSSDEEKSSSHARESRPHPLSADLKDSDDSEDDYYTRWSKDPGTLTPGPDDIDDEPLTERPARILQPLSALRNQDELDEEYEEYDQSYNPLFTVPSVPNLMDAHTAALSELTNILQTSLPQQPQAKNRAFVQPMTQINPLPKAVSRLRNGMEDLSMEECKKGDIPGAYPESGHQTPATTLSAQDHCASLNLPNKEAGRGLFMNSLSALIGAARLLGYEGKDILEMVQEIVNKPSSS